MERYITVHVSLHSDIDKASQVLAQGPPAGVSRSYRAIADHSGVPRATLHHRSRGRRSIEEKAESQQYLNVNNELQL